MNINYKSFSSFDIVHIGKLIQEELKRQERTPAWLARKIHCERTNIYYIFSLQSINTEMLRQICRALGRDFFAEYSAELSDDERQNS